MSIRQDVFSRLFEQRGRARKPRPQPVGDLPQLRQRRRVIRLREDGAHDGRDRFTRLRRNAVQKARSSDGPTSTPSTCRSPSLVMPIATTVAWLITRPSTRTLWYVAIQPQIPMLTRQRPRPKRSDDGVELAHDARHFRLRDAVQP